MHQRPKEQIGYPYNPVPRRSTRDYYPPEQEASRHYTGHNAGLRSESDPRKTIQRPVRDPETYRNTSAIRHRPLETVNLQKQKVKWHWMVFVGIGLFIMIAGWIAFNTLGNWWQTQQNDWTYGRTRTFQMDAVVGHSDSETTPSHFIAMNLNRHIIVIEFPGGDATHAIAYIGPILVGDGQDLTPVTLSFQDVNGDGKVDMLVHIADQTIVFLNNGTKFVAPHQTRSGSATASFFGGTYAHSSN